MNEATIEKHGRKFGANQQSLWLGVYCITACLVVVVIRPEFGAHAALFLAGCAAIIAAKDGTHAVGNAMAKKGEAKK